MRSSTRSGAEMTRPDPVASVQAMEILSLAMPEPNPAYPALFQQDDACAAIVCARASVRLTRNVDLTFHNTVLLLHMVALIASLETRLTQLGIRKPSTGSSTDYFLLRD